MKIEMSCVKFANVKTLIMCFFQFCNFATMSSKHARNTIFFFLQASFRSDYLSHQFFFYRSTIRDRLIVKSSFKLDWVDLTRLASRRSRLELELESSSSLLTCQELELDSSFKLYYQSLSLTWLKLKSNFESLTWAWKWHHILIIV